MKSQAFSDVLNAAKKQIFSVNRYDDENMLIY